MCVQCNKMGYASRYRSTIYRNIIIGESSHGDIMYCCPVDISIYSKTRCFRLLYGKKLKNEHETGHPSCILAFTTENNKEIINMNFTTKLNSDMLIDRDLINNVKYLV
eukprot:GHVR01166821.1.p2 GENE.GHVR01166821.1~~GHVR01166821.1.p2  ORF type:complete len:108 (-),score=9.64 GHVR01166821.1:361-684(-)